MHDITVRRMDFGFERFEDGIDPILIDGEPEQSYGLIGLSLLLPYLEPYLIRTMKEARKRVRDPELEKDLERFNAQEGQHYRQHRRFNEAIRMRGFPGLAALEADLESDYQRFTATKSLRFNLAYAEGFEALTTASARFAFQSGQLERVRGPAGQLFAWHLIEELEHRTVAFDVYDHVCGGYLYRLGVGLFAQWHMSTFIGRATRYMLEADPDWPDAYGGREGVRARRRIQSRRAMRGFLPKLLATYAPWYTPSRIEFTDEMRALSKRYSELAVGTS